MEKAELLLVLALQVFLLVSSFTSADGATLRTDEEYSPEGMERRNIRNQGVFGNRGRKCRREGLCVRFGGEARAFDMYPPPPPPRPDSGEEMDETEIEVEGLRGNHRPRVTSNCSRRPGGCVLPVLPYDPRLHGPPPPPPPTPGPETSSSFRRDVVEMRLHGRRGYPRYRPTSYCSWRHGACGPVGLPGPPDSIPDSREDVINLTSDPNSP